MLAQVTGILYIFVRSEIINNDTCIMEGTLHKNDIIFSKIINETCTFISLGLKKIYGKV